MSKLMWIAGIILIAIGLALGLMVFASPSSVVGWGINPGVAVELIVGGVLALGLGGVVNALQNLPAPRVEIPDYVPPASSIPEFGRRAAEQAGGAAAVAAVAEEAADEVSEPVKETIAALEQARQKIEQAFEPPAEQPQTSSGLFKTETAPAVEPEPEEVAAEPEIAPEPEVASEPEPETEPEAEVAEEPEALEGEEAEEVLEEGQLYVVEERFIRQRPARILSDGTVEAETDEGWMRFENLEHLDEYLDAMMPPSRG